LLDGERGYANFDLFQHRLRNKGLGSTTISE
jgi:hypothetical protein